MKFRLKHAFEVILRVLVWSVCAALSLAVWVLLFHLLAGCEARADSIALLRWEVETSRPAAYKIELVRGETVYLEPQYLSYQTPVNLDDVYEVVLRYRDTSLPDGYYYAVTGTVSDVVNGRVKITWTPAAEAVADAYTYTIAAKTLGGDTLRAFGAIRLTGSVTGSVTNQPNVTTTFDWSAVEHINLTNAPFLSDAELSAIEADVLGLQTGKVDVLDWLNTNAALRAEIEASQGLATMGGDVSGPSTNATVIKIRNVPVSELSPGAEENGYGLKYDHATGSLLLGPVATAGNSISNLLLLSGTAVVSDVAVTNVGVYRIIRPGNLPSMVLNVGGYETAYFDLLGITLKAGGLHLLSDYLAVNPAAYDGAATSPAYTWDEDRDLGKFRMSYNGDYGEGYCVNSNLVWFWAADGLHLTNGSALYGMDYTWLINVPDLGVYAGTGTVAALDQRLTTVEAWPTDTWSTAYGWGDHAMEGYLTDEADPLALHTSSTYTAWTDAGGTYTQEGVFASSALLTNGYAGISYSAAGMSVVVESSTDSNTWGTAVATNTAVYLRLSANNDIPPFGEPSLTISNIIATSWSHPATWGQISDTAGQIVLVDNPTVPRQAVNKQALDEAVVAVTPNTWAQYPATTNVNLSGHRLIMTEGWTLTQTGGVGIISYADAWATSNELTIAHNGVAVISAQSGVGGLHIDDFSIVGSNVTLWVSTNGVVSAPLPQYTADLLAPDWATIGSYTSTYPVVTNSAYRIDFDLPDGNTGFFRAIQQVSAGLVNISADLQVQGAYPWRPQTHTNDAPGEFTPRWIGDELIIHDSTNIVYRAFGSTTNDWVSVWP